MKNTFKYMLQKASKFIVNSFRPEEVEVTIKNVGGRMIYSYVRVSHK